MEGTEKSESDSDLDDSFVVGFFSCSLHYFLFFLQHHLSLCRNFISLHGFETLLSVFYIVLLVGHDVLSVTTGTERQEERKKSTS